MAKKAFFQTRTKNEIKDLELKDRYRAKGLVWTIMDLDSSKEALVIRFPILPGRFLANTSDWTQANRKCYKHGDLIALSQPKTQGESYLSNEIPLAVRARDFSKLSEMNEEDIDYIGYSFFPLQGRDRRKRKVPFIWVVEGQRLFAYAQNNTRGIEIKPYIDSGRVNVEGAEIVVNVPSRTQKKPRYNLKLQNVPVKGNTERRAVIYSLKSSYEIDVEHSLWNIRYTWEREREGKEQFTFYPHDVAAYLAVAGKYWKEHNLTPMEMNPFALFSQKGVDFHKRLENNVLIFDPTLKTKDKLRKLQLAEKSILDARAIGVYGHDEIAFWDPERDGRLKDYDWSIGGLG